MEVKIISGEASTYLEAPQIHIVALGKIKENSSAKVQIEITGVGSSTLIPTCGCTATESHVKNTYDINYLNTNILGLFSKILVLNYEEGGKKLVANIKLTGDVIK